jgi:hypothetical protein
MSKSNKEDQPLENKIDPAPAGNENPENSPGGNPPPENNSNNSPGSETKPEMLTIEELSKQMKVDAPVFAAVMQSKQWASGKRVPEADFKKAVEDFLGAPIDGRKPPEKKIPENKEGS